MKLLKILSRIGIVLLIVVVVALLVRAALNFTEGRKLAGVIAELKAKGAPLSAKDLAAPCPDADNAARLWKAAVNLLAVENDDKGLLGRAFMDLVASKPLGPADRSAIAGVIAKNRAALELLYAMAEKPCFLYRDPGAPLPELMGPDAVKMILATRLMGFDALLKAESGDIPSAVDRIRAGLGSVSKVAQEGTLLTYLIAVAETRMLLSFLEAACRRNEVAGENLFRLVADLEPSPWRERLAKSISGDRVFMLESGLDTIQSNFQAMDDKKLFNRLLYWLLRPVLKDEVRWQLEKLNRWEQMARDPYFMQRELLKTDPAFSGDAPWYFKLTGFLDGGAYGTIFLKGAQLEATFLASRTGLACRLYKSRNGSYPENLKALVPAILKEVPTDPFTGKPLVYRREGEGFIVYSLGSNLKDDGGRSTYMITQLVMDKDDDWTWKEDR
jgi:hypothetical protein